VYTVRIWELTIEDLLGVLEKPR